MNSTADYISYHLCYLAILLLLTQSLNWIWKIGLFSLGQQAFYAAGAYTGIITFRLLLPFSRSFMTASGFGQWLLFLAFSGVLGAVVAGGLGAFLFAALRHLRSDYFAVGTLVFSQALLAVLRPWGYVGGSQGFDLMPQISTANDRIAHFSVFLVGGLLANLGLYWLFTKSTNSVAGVFLLASRDDELAARSCGIPVYWLQFASFVVCSSIAGFAGVWLLHFTAFVHVDDFCFTNSLPIITYVVLGAGSTLRCIAAAAVLYVGYQALMLPVFGQDGGRFAQAVADWQTTLYALFMLGAATIALRRARCR